jgi:hypothetical protein
MLQAWLRQIGTFLRMKAPHQLLLSGLEGFFGASSPHLLQHNPYTQASTATGSTGAATSTANTS